MNEADKERTASVVSLLIRLVVGVILFFAGLSKAISLIGGSVGYGDFIGNFLGGVKGTWAYNWPFRAFMYIFFALLPWLELALGLALIVGYRTRIALIASAVLLGHLMFGMALQGNHATVANNSQYVIYCALAYYFTTQGNRYSLDALLADKW